MNWILPEEAYTDKKKLSARRKIRFDNKEVWGVFMTKPIVYVNNWATAARDAGQKPDLEGDDSVNPVTREQKEILYEKRKDKFDRIFEDQERLVWVINEWQWAEYRK